MRVFDPVPPLRYLNVEKSLSGSPFKNLKCKKQKKLKVEAYFFIPENLSFLRRRGNWEFFNGLLNPVRLFQKRAFGKTVEVKHLISENKIEINTMSHSICDTVRIHRKNQLIRFRTGGS